MPATAGAGDAARGKSGAGVGVGVGVGVVVVKRTFVGLGVDRHGLCVVLVVCARARV